MLFLNPYVQPNIQLKIKYFKHKVVSAQICVLIEIFLKKASSHIHCPWVDQTLFSCSGYVNFWQTLYESRDANKSFYKPLPFYPIFHVFFEVCKVSLALKHPRGHRLSKGTLCTLRYLQNLEFNTDLIISLIFHLRVIQYLFRTNQFLTIFLKYT